MSMSDQTINTILGSLLGDGSLKLHKNYRNARFSFKHSTKQKEYFFWKVSLLKEISGKSFVWKQGDDGYGKNKFRYQSRALEPLTELHELTHKRNIKIVRRKWLNKMTPLSLLVWWLDDGSLVANGRKGVFCTDSFTEKEVRILSRYLKIVWNIDTKLGKVTKKLKSGKTSYRLYIYSTENLKAFLRIILPFLEVEQMLPKVLIVYHDPKLQQRWTSEICRLTGFSIEMVEHYLSIRKSKLKAYQKKI